MPGGKVADRGCMVAMGRFNSLRGCKLWSSWCVGEEDSETTDRGLRGGEEDSGQGFWGRIQQIIKVKFDLPYLNQHTHTVIVTPYYIFNLLNQII